MLTPSNSKSIYQYQSPIFLDNDFKLILKTELSELSLNIIQILFNWSIAKIEQFLNYHSEHIFLYPTF